MHFVEAKGILSGSLGINPYRGCTHGCIYCDSRSVCYQMKHDFEDIEVKINAPELLDRALAGKRQKCMISTGSMCDPYMPCEGELRITRSCLESIYRRGFGADVLTKSDLILRDIDLLEAINRRTKAVVQMTLTTCDEELCRVLEPNVCATYRRYQVLKEFQARDVPTAVWLTPLLPFINDTAENLRGILEYCFDAGVKAIVSFGFGLTLREGDREYFYAALDKHFPGLKRKYARRYGLAYEVVSDNSAALMEILSTECEKRGVMYRADEVFKWLKELPQDSEQLSMF